MQREPRPETEYLFKSGRLGFRTWLLTDAPAMFQINQDPVVMEFFPHTKSQQQTLEFIVRMQNQFEIKKYCYFAVDRLIDRQFIGFIGLSEQTFPSDFTPCIDIGWRLKKEEWHKGYATEGARRCLRYGFEDLGLNKIVSFAPSINLRSLSMMEKIGLHKVKTFRHPLLTESEHLQECVLYEIFASDPVNRLR
jgi:RimJ/RimL family protein N-acetyltransferase